MSIESRKVVQGFIVPVCRTKIVWADRDDVTEDDGLRYEVAADGSMRATRYECIVIRTRDRERW